MQHPTRDNGSPALGSESLEEVEDDSLPQDLSLGELDFTSQDISLKGMPHCIQAGAESHLFRNCCVALLKNPSLLM